MKNAMTNKKLNDFELDFVAGGTLTEVNQLADAFAKKGGIFGEVVAEIHSALNSKTGVAGPINILLREAVGKGLSQRRRPRHRLHVQGQQVFLQRQEHLPCRCTQDDRGSKSCLR